MNRLLAGILVGVGVCDDHLREIYRYEYFSDAVTTLCLECTVIMRSW
jgi:hypothetical protein